MYKIISSRLEETMDTKRGFLAAMVHVLSPFILVAVTNTPFNTTLFLLLLLPVR